MTLRPPAKRSIARSPQLALRLDSRPVAPASRWCDGVQLTYLGSCLTLRTQATGHGPLRLGDELHLPLPPDASARQIQDGVEAWLRQEARRVIGACLEAEQQRLGGVLPEWTLSFAVQGAWVQETAEGGLRFNWRLIEQTPDVIHQTVAAALAGLSRPGSCGDLWDQPCS